MIFPCGPCLSHRRPVLLRFKAGLRPTLNRREGTADTHHIKKLHVMKTLVKIKVDDGGISYSECEVETELDTKRLIANILVLMNENENFKKAIMESASIMQSYPNGVRILSEMSKRSAEAKLGNEKQSSKS